MKPGHELRINASSSADLMRGDNQLTENQVAEMEKLQNRQKMAAAGVDGWKPLTPKMEATLADLEKRFAAPLELGQTAQSMVKDKWRYKKFGFRKEVFKNELTKGSATELDCIELMDFLYPEDQLRQKNEERRFNEFFQGETDVYLDKIKIPRNEDIKSCFDLATFQNTIEPDEGYYSQGQVYMDLWNTDVFWLCYCLVNTPEFIVRRIQWSLYYQFRINKLDTFEEMLIHNKSFAEACQQIAINHNYDHIDEADKVKVFVFERNDEYIAELKYRAKWAQDYYDSLKLKQDKTFVPAENFKRTYVYQKK